MKSAASLVLLLGIGMSASARAQPPPTDIEPGFHDAEPPPVEDRTGEPALAAAEQELKALEARHFSGDILRLHGELSAFSAAAARVSGLYGQVYLGTSNPAATVAVLTRNAYLAELLARRLDELTAKDTCPKELVKLGAEACAIYKAQLARQVGKMIRPAVTEAEERYRMACAVAEALGLDNEDRQRACRGSWQTDPLPQPPVEEAPRREPPPPRRKEPSPSIKVVDLPGGDAATLRP